MLPLVTEFSLSLLQFSRFLKMFGGSDTPHTPPVATPLLQVSRFTRSSGNWQIRFHYSYHMSLIESVFCNMSSLRLFKNCLFFAFIINSFSSRHRLHRIDPAVYGATRLTILIKKVKHFLNRRSEFFSKCRHVTKHCLNQWDVIRIVDPDLSVGLRSRKAWNSE